MYDNEVHIKEEIKEGCENENIYSTCAKKGTELLHIKEEVDKEIHIKEEVKECEYETCHVTEEAKEACVDENVYSTCGKKWLELLHRKEEADKEIHSVNIKVEEVPVKEEDKEACEDGIYSSYIKKENELMHVKEKTNEVFQGICINEEAEMCVEYAVNVKEYPEAVYKDNTGLHDPYADQANEMLHPPHEVSRQDNTTESSQHIYTNTSSDVTQYQCKHCNKRFGSKSALAKHEHTYSKSSPKKAMKLYNCNQCSYTTKSKGNLRCHKKLHTGDKPYKCNHCNFKCITNSKLKSHLRIHTGEKPFKCSHCDYTSSHTTNLRQHEKTHTREEPFQCNHCQLKFARKDHLRNHELVHTDERSFKCDNCGYKAKRKADLQVHQRVHTGEKPYKCRHCNNVFAYKKNLNIHLKSKHSGEQLPE